MIIVDEAPPQCPPGVAFEAKTTTRSIGLPKGSPSVHLDALRGFAAFSVMIAHWRDAFFVDFSEVPHHNPFLSFAYFATGLGHQWVIVFFVMSGFLVGGSVLRSVSLGRWAWQDYLLSRLSRLYLVLLPALLIGGTIDWVGMHMLGANAIYSGQSGMHILTFDVHSTLTLSALLENLAFLQTIVLPWTGGQPAPWFGTNGALWSLSNEFWYYMAFPLLVLLLTRKEFWRIRLLCGIGLLVWGYFVGTSIALLGIAWLMGVLITILPTFPARQAWTRTLAIAFALASLTGGFMFGKAKDDLFRNLILGTIVTFLIWVTLHCATAPLPSLYVRMAQRAARSSYTLYLVHLPMLIFLKAWLHIPRSVPNWQSLVPALGVLLVIVLYAQLIYELFEKNTDAVRRWVKTVAFGRRPA